jgi:DNA-binding response OmpR family regulator
MAAILLIEDEQAFASILSTWLRRSGHQVTLLPNARKALQTLKASSIDLVLTDMVMPDKDGLEVIEELRRAGVTLPIIGMSGSTQQAPLLLNMAKKLGANKVLFKPFGQDELDAAIQAALGVPVTH